MTQTVQLNYGTTQLLLSSKMQKNPTLSKIVNKVFGYTNIGNYARAKVFRNQISQLPLHEMKQILDLGCGYGEYSFMVAKALPNVKLTALDIDPDALRNVEYAQSKLQLKNLTIHRNKLDTLDTEGFDLIYSVDVFEHIPEAHMPFADAFKKLRNGGHLIVKMPNLTQSSVFPKKWFEAHQEWLNHEHPGQVYTLTDLKNRFEKEGFEVVFAAQTDGILSRLAWELAYLMKKGGSVMQLISLPISKLLVNLDWLITRGNTSRGNAITVIGKKK